MHWAKYFDGFPVDLGRDKVIKVADKSDLMFGIRVVRVTAPPRCSF